MVDSNAVAEVAHAMIPASPSQAHLGKARESVFLRQIGDEHYRWFHADGTQTVVDGRSIAHALHVAALVWGEVQLVSRAPD